MSTPTATARRIVPTIFASMVLTLSTALAISPHAQSAQDSGAASDVAATYRDGDVVSQVGTTEVGIEIARRERLRPYGQEALQHLIDKTLVVQAATAAKLWPSKAEIAAGMAKFRAQLEAADVDLEAFLREKNLSLATFETEYVAHSLAHEKLVMQSARLRDQAAVTPELLALWLEEARDRAKVVADPEKLPSGVVARIDDRDLTLADLGEVLLQNAARPTRVQAIQQIVVRRLLEDAARQRGLQATTADIDAEIERRRALIEADPQYKGVPFEQLLRSQGTSIEELRNSPVIRSQVLRDKLGDVLFDATELTRRLTEDRESVLREHGAHRHIHAIFVRAAEEPTEFIPLDFAAAERQIRAVRARMDDDGISFADAARIHSDDPAAKVRGGDMGLHARGSDTLPAEVVEAAFALEPYTMSEPVRTAGGYYLVKVTEAEPTPSDAVLRERLREASLRDYVRDLLERADIQIP